MELIYWRLYQNITGKPHPSLILSYLLDHPLIFINGRNFWVYRGLNLYAAGILPFKKLDYESKKNVFRIANIIWTIVKEGI